jgi:WD40 repeat protein
MSTERRAVGTLLDTENPWPGLSSFDEAAQRFFNGRDAETAGLLLLVGQAPLTVLFGRSGLGKTSLVQAGLFPRLRQQNILPVYVRLDVRDRSAPLIRQAAAALHAEIGKHGVDASAPDSDESLWEHLHGRHQWWSRKNQPLTPLFVFDQFEETFTLGAENLGAVERLRLDLADIIENRIPAELARRFQAGASAEHLDLRGQHYKVILSFREDFLPDVEGWKGDLPSLMRNRRRLLPMSADQALQVVSGNTPTGRTHELVNDDTAREIVRFVAAVQAADEKTGRGRSPGQDSDQSRDKWDRLELEPALLSLVCEGLNAKRKARGQATIDAALLNETGNAIIGDFYRRCVADVPPRTRRFIEDALITERGFRNSYPLHDALDQGHLTESLLRQLVDRRLLRIDHQFGVDRVELIHDRLTAVVREHRDQERVRIRARQQRRMWWAASSVVGVLGAVGALFFSLWQSAQRSEGAARRGTDAAKAALRQAVAGKLVMQSRAILEGQRSGPTELALLMGAAGYRLKPDNDAYGGLQYAINATQGISKIVAFPERIIAISPDRMTVVSEKDRTLRLWDVPTALPRGVPLSGHTHNIMSVAFSPDGKTLVTVSADTTVRLWDTLTGQPRGAPLEGHTRWVDHVAFSPDGKTFASSSQDALRLWDAATGTLRGGLDRPDAGWADVRSLAFSHDGKTLVSGSGDLLTEDVNSLRLWDAATGDPRSRAMKGHTAPVSSVALSPSGKIVASGSADNTVRLWDAASGKPRREPLRGHTNRVQIVAFSPDGNTLASGSDDCTLRLWDGVTGQPRGAPLTGHTNWVMHLAFSPDGKTIVSSDDNSVRLWDVVTGQPRGVLEGYMLRGEGAAFSPDSKTVFYGDRNTLRVSDVGQLRGVPLQGHTSVVWTVAFSPDGKTIVSGSLDKSLRLWDVATGQPHGMPLLGHTDGVETVAFSPDGKTLISRSGDKTLRLWDVADALPRGEPFEGYQYFVGSVVWSPDGHTLISRGEGDTARLWDVATRLPRGVPLQGHTSSVVSVAFSNDSKTLVSGSYDHTLRLWDTATGLPLGAPMQGQSNGEEVAFSPDGKTIVSSDGSTLRLWDLATRQPRGGALTGKMVSTPGGVFSADETTLVSIDGSTLRLWDVTNGQPRGAPLQGHANSVTSVAFSPDGKTLVSGSDDWTLRLWDVATAQPRGMPLEGHTAGVTSVAFSPDGNTIVSGSRDKTLRLWDSPNVWIDRICAKLVRNLSRAEWKQYVGDVPYETQCPGLPIPEN